MTSGHVVVKASVGSKCHITDLARIDESVWEVLGLAVVSNICWGSIGEVMAVAAEVGAHWVSEDILLQILRTAQSSWAKLCQPPSRYTNFLHILFIQSTLGQVEVKCSFSILSNAATGTTVEERVRKVAALNVPLHIGLWVVGKSLAYATSGPPLSSNHILIEILWRPQDTKMRP